MKIRRRRGEPRLRKVTWAFDDNGIPIIKDTPKLDLDNHRRVKLELKLLKQPPKIEVEKIIVPD